jgi:hypothetical protein
MLAEAVLLLASGDPDLPDRAGVLTPATGLGMPMIERLRAAGMTFEAGPWVPEADEGEDVEVAAENASDAWASDVPAGDVPAGDVPASDVPASDVPAGDES